MIIRCSPIAGPPAPHLEKRSKEAEELVIHEPQSTSRGRDYSIVVVLVCKLTRRQEPCCKDEVPSASATWPKTAPCDLTFA